jgi:CheY-like chemotaxis protein
VKSLVEMHGGMVEAHSDGLGRGSRFVVACRSSRRPANLRRSQPPAKGRQVSRRILIVDDNEDGATSLAMLLELGGHDVHVAHDGLEAIEAAERLRPEVMLLDIGLPKLNGYEVCKADPGAILGEGLLLVAVTGWGQDEDRHRSKEAGFNAHIVKPVDTEALRTLLKALPAAASTEN